MKTNDNAKGRRPFTLCCGLLLLLAVVSTEASAALVLNKDVSTNYSITLFAVFDGLTKVGLQIPLDIEEASIPPHHGTVWSWSAETIDGFNARIPTISFTHENDTSGFHTKAVLHFDLSDWVRDESGSNADGSFVLKLSNGVPAENRLYGISVTLRSVTEGFTIIEGQSKTPTLNEPGFSAAGKEGFSTTVEMFDWGLSMPPLSESLTLSAEGRVVDYDFSTGPWNSDGTCRLQVTDGSRPTSTVTGINVSLRSLMGDGLTVIEGQSYQPGVAGNEGVNAVGVHGFSFTAPSADISLAGVTGASLSFDAMCRVMSYGFPGTGWNQEGDFILYAKDGARPTSVIPNRALALRQLVGDGLTVIEGQSYQPGVAGTEGVNAVGVHGFSFTAPSADISLAGVTGASLSFDAMCRVMSYGFPGTGWNQEGDFILYAKDGARPTSVIPNRALALRQLVGDGLTVIEGQSYQPGVAGTEGVNAVGVHGFSFTAPSADISLAGVTGASLSFDAMCRVMSYGFPGTSWNQEGDFILYAKDGARPTSVIPNRALALRQLVGDGLTVIEGQSYQPGVAGTEGVNAVGVHGFSFTAPSADISLAGVTGASLSFDAMCRVMSYGFPGTGWNQEGDFILYAKDGARPTSVIPNRALALRQLVGDGLTVIEGQSYQPGVAGTEGVNAVGVHGFSFTAPSADISLAGVTGASLSFDAMCRVMSYGFPGTGWNQEGDFILYAKDGARPSSVILGRTLSLRNLSPETLTIPDNGRAGSINLQVQGDVGPWDWTDYEDGLANSVLTAPDSFDTSSLAISWAAGSVESGESGTGTVTIQRSDGSSPASTVELETTVVEAPQLPVSYWPILALMLVAVGVALVKRDEDSPVHH